MAKAPDAAHEELLWSVAVARLILGPAMNIQAPPNLSPLGCAELIDAGINDWGGVSPVTPDHVNPEAPWPAIDELTRVTATRGRILVERLPGYPQYCLDAKRWHEPDIATAIVRASDAEGFARADPWSPGLSIPLAMPFLERELRGEREGPDGLPEGARSPCSTELRDIVAKARSGAALTEREVEILFRARGDEFDFVCEAADRVRREHAGEVVRYVVNRNINYTNICSYRCTFCAFSKGTHARALRGTPYEVPLPEIERRVAEAWRRGATEVCMQGGIHPSYTGETYLGILRAAKRAVPQIHVHAFTPLEVSHGAATLGMTVRDFLRELIAAGLGSLPGTAAEILDDEVMETAHELGLRSTVTIMFGHVEGPRHWARHLLRIRELQERTGGFTEFVPLPFVHMEAPVYRRGQARKGPTSREAILMHAVARLALNPVIPHIQVSWVKMGAEGARRCLAAGADDLGGTLMNESISRAAGTQHGQELPPASMDALIHAAGRVPAQRTTLYGTPSAGQSSRSYRAGPLEQTVQSSPSRDRDRARAGTA
jgi:FO synthase